MIYIDHSVYPDLPDPPESLETPEDKADYVHRVCAAWDFHILPEPETFDLFSGWKDVFDRFPIPTSPAYHAFRAWFGWEPVPMPLDVPPPTPLYVHLDRLEGRAEDPCEGMI
jgi:hypothetical protein